MQVRTVDVDARVPEARGKEHRLRDGLRCRHGDGLEYAGQRGDGGRSRNPPCYAPVGQVHDSCHEVTHHLALGDPLPAVPPSDDPIVEFPALEGRASVPHGAVGRGDDARVPQGSGQIRIPGDEDLRGRLPLSPLRVGRGPGECGVGAVRGEEAQLVQAPQLAPLEAHGVAFAFQPVRSKRATR